jgi:thiol-disulfide isomerase/thioredoxin
MKNMETTKPTNSVVVIATAVIGLGVLASGYLYFNNQNKQLQDTAVSSSKSVSDAMMKKEEDTKMKAEAAMKSEEAMKKEEAMKNGETMSSESTMSKSSEVMVKAGSFKDYDKALLTNASTGKVVIFFSAPWCPTCNATNKDLNSKLDKIPSNITILKADYDTSTELKKQYGVTQQHTFVQVDANGSQIKKSVGLSTLEDITSFLN